MGHVGASEVADRASEILEGLGEGFLALDGDWRVIDCGSEVLRIFNCGRQDLLGRTVWDVSGLAPDSPFGAVIQRVALTRTPEDAEIAYQSEDDERLLTLRIFRLGSGVGAVLRDITEMRSAEQRLAESESRYRELADGTPAAAWLSTADGELEFINQAMADALGRSREALLGGGWMAAVDPDDEPAMIEVRTKARASHSAFHHEGRFRRADGSLRVIQLYGRPRFDDSGAFRGYVGMATDVTEARAAERQRNLLIGELNHRLKNTLATVQSLIRQTLREAEVPNEVADVVAGRLVALSEAHNVLNRELWEGADLLSIAEAVVKPYADGARITITGPTARVEANNAVTVAMGLHELAVNSLKHGALSTPTGQVRLNWTQTGDSIVLQWRESGGPRVTPPSHSGFGLRLLRGGLGADLAYEPDGLICGMRVAAQQEDNPLVPGE